MKDDILAAFMMSSIMLNPQLTLYSAALGRAALAVRIITCFLCGITAGLLVRIYYKDKSYFNFSGFAEPKNRDTDPNLLLRFLKNLGRNINHRHIFPDWNRPFCSVSEICPCRSDGGSVTKITNLGAVKIVLGGRRFLLSLLYIMLFALVSGWIVNWVF